MHFPISEGKNVERPVARVSTNVTIFYNCTSRGGATRIPTIISMRILRVQRVINNANWSL